MYYGLAVAAMRAEGWHVDDEALAHISPAHSEYVNFFGIIDVDVEGELAKLDGAGYRPLRDAGRRSDLLLRCYRGRGTDGAEHGRGGGLRPACRPYDDHRDQGYSHQMRRSVTRSPTSATFE